MTRIGILAQRRRGQSFEKMNYRHLVFSFACHAKLFADYAQH